MNKAKRIFLILAVIALLSTSLLGCGNNNAANGGTNEQVEKPNTQATEPAHTATTQPNENSNAGRIPLPDLNENKDLEVTEFGYSIVSSGSSMWLYYSIFLHNPNENVAARFPSYRITAFSEDGRVLGTDRSVRSQLSPDSTLVFGGMAFSVDEYPARVEVEAEPIENRNWLSNYESYETLEIEGAHINDRGRILGQISNPNDKGIDSVLVVAIYRNDDGTLLGGDFTFERNLAPLGSLAFEMIGHDFEGARSFEVFAFPN